MYLPDLPHVSYARLLTTLERELSHAFGGCTVVRGLDGSYLSTIGVIIHDRVNLLYSDAPFSFDSQFAILSDYADQLREAAFHALQDEAILVVVYPVYHAE